MNKERLLKVFYFSLGGLSVHLVQDYPIILIPVLGWIIWQVIKA
jgi:hypothetical protein